MSENIGLYSSIALVFSESIDVGYMIGQRKYSPRIGTDVRCSISSKTTLSVANRRDAPTVLTMSGMRHTGMSIRIQESGCPPISVMSTNGMRVTPKVYRLEKTSERIKRYLGTGI